MINQQGLGIQIINNGLVLPEYTKDGRTYVAAPWNTDYKIRVLVPDVPGLYRPKKRVKAVISVDGINVYSGQRATADGAGYVVTPPSSPTANDLPGFRLNDKEVAKFRFGDRQDSYAALLAKPENIGVIGVVFYDELEPRPAKSVSRGCGTRSAGGHDVGTEFGDRQDFVVTSTTFECGSEVARFQIEYASHESLKAAGIITESPLGTVNPFAD